MDTTITPVLTVEPKEVAGNSSVELVPDVSGDDSNSYVELVADVSGDDSFAVPLVEYIQLRPKDIPEYREKLVLEQKGLCAICNDPLDLTSKTSGVSLDHQHKTQAEIIGVKGAGLIRGVLCRDCNTFEGKIWNNSKRFNKFDKLPEFLRAVADYLEKPNYPWIHPNEAPKPKKVSKRQYNKLCKAYANSKLTAKIPPFPGKRAISKKLQGLFDRFEISPYT